MYGHIDISNYHTEIMLNKLILLPKKIIYLVPRSLPTTLLNHINYK